MPYPKIQYVLARKRGRKTQYFYGEKLKDLLERVRENEPFQYFKLSRGQMVDACLTYGGTLITKTRRG